MMWDPCAYRRAFVTSLLLVQTVGAEVPLEQQFRDPASSVARPSVTLRLAAAPGDAEACWRRLEQVREMGAGGILLRVPTADQAVWAALAKAAERCRQMGLELGVCDFALSSAEAAEMPRAQKLAWSSRQTEGPSLATNSLPPVYGPDATYREVARLAVPAAGAVLPHQVVDLAQGALPAEGPWRVLCFGRTEVAPPVMDVYEGAAAFRHVNQMLSELQSRLEKSYGTSLLWYQVAGAGNSELVWPRDMAAAFLKRSGLDLVRHLPALAGVPVGGEATAAYVRQQVALTVREAWRSRYAEKVGELVHEAGLDTGIAIGEVPVDPEEAALYFRRPMLSAARSELQRRSNVRAAGGARTMGRRFILGRLSPEGFSETPASALLAFPFKHEMDGLFGDGATRLLLDADEGAWDGAERFAQGRQACRYAQRCQVLLQHGEAVADLLAWTEEVPPALEGYSCDYACQRMLEAATVRAGRIWFDSERSYGALAVSVAVLREPSKERLARQLAAKGLGVWVAGSGAPEEAALVEQVTRGEKGFCKVPGAAGVGGVQPDFVWQAESRELRLRFLHRRSPEAEIYFVMNGSACGGPVTCTFRDTGKGAPERWEPLSGEVGVVQEVERQADGRMSMPLYLGPHDACFVVFDR